MDKPRPRITLDDYLDILAERVAATIAPLYAAHGWTWHEAGGGQSVPGEDAITICLRNLLTSVMHAEDDVQQATGRLLVRRDSELLTTTITVLLEVAAVHLSNDL